MGGFTNSDLFLISSMVKRTEFPYSKHESPQRCGLPCDYDTSKEKSYLAEAMFQFTEMYC